MKQIVKCAMLAVTVAAILSAVGCAQIRNYSANSYQGVMPVDDTRPSGFVPTTPAQPPTAAPRAGK